MARSVLALVFLSTLSMPLTAQAQAVFDLVDTDGDGFVSRAELDAARMERFLSLDRNKDGVVDRSEMMVGPGQGRKGYTAEETQAVLSSYDHDGDGLITKEEVEEAIERLNVFSGIDTDGDGKLTKEEAAGVLDIRERGGVSMSQILDELSQGKRTTAGFRPVRAVVAPDPFEVARHNAAGGAAYGASDIYQPQAPSVWNDPQNPGVVDVNSLSRDGYVARRVDPMRAGSLDPYLPGAVPPDGPTHIIGQPQSAPITHGQTLAQGANWREVILDANGQPLP